MTSEIPEDIRRAAAYAVGMAFAGVTLGRDVDRAAEIVEDAKSFIVQALLAERERCAKIAATFQARHCEGHKMTVLEQGEWKIASVVDMPHMIASAIRQQATP